MTESNPSSLTPSIEQVERTILDEIYKALNLPLRFFFRPALDWLFVFPLRRFTTIVCQFDRDISTFGLTQATRRMLPFFVEGVDYIGQETIPASGPLLVIANHPGVFDSFCLTAGLGRDDLLVVVYETPFYRQLPNVSAHLIYAKDTPHERMAALRETIQRLREGWAVLIFGSGMIAPDPAAAEGAILEVEQWSKSLEIMVRQAPEAQVVLAAIRGVLSRKFANHPIMRLRQEPIDKRRLAEFLQIIVQVIRKTRLGLRPQIRFGLPLGAGDLSERLERGALHRYLIEQEQALLRVDDPEPGSGSPV
jgi:hypothetical protein